jgi:hypothetical protein
MIKLLGLLFIFGALYGEENIFQLPDQHSRFVHQLSRALKNSSDLLIITPAYQHSALKKGILDAAKRGTMVTLIVQDLQGDPLSMVQYERITLYTTRAPLLQTIILIDGTLACTSDGAIREDDFGSKRSLIRCSDDPETIRTLRHAQHSIMNHSKLYLE